MNLELTYIRLYADEEGESHFEDVEITFQETDFIPPAPPLLVSSFNPTEQYGFEIVPSGYYGDWHPAPGRVLAIFLTGQGEIEASDREVRTTGPGVILLAEDTTGKGHISRSTGSSESLVAILLLPD